MSLESREEIETRAENMISELSQTIKLINEHWPRYDEGEDLQEAFFVVERYLKKKIITLNQDL
jgi:hypothetical protein